MTKEQQLREIKRIEASNRRRRIENLANPKSINGGRPNGRGRPRKAKFITADDVSFYF